MHYKVWIEVEQIDEDTDHYETLPEPIDVGVFDIEDEALCFQARLEALAETSCNECGKTQRLNACRCGEMP